MTNDTEFKAWRVQEQDGEYEGSEQTLHVSDLPENDVLIKVSHSSLNYKDALSASGNKGVTRSARKRRPDQSQSFVPELQGCLVGLRQQGCYT